MKREIEGRPFVLFAAGLIIATACIYSLTNLIFLVLVFCLLADLSAKRVSKAQWIFVAGCLVALIRPPVVAGPSLLETKPFAGQVDLLSMPDDGQSRQRVLASTEHGRVILSATKRTEMSLGDRVYVVGDLRPLNEASEPRERARGAYAELRAITVTPIDRGGWLFRQGLAMRRSFVEFVGTHLDPRAAAVVDAVCFNQDAELTPETTDALRRTGTIHIISTSGLHVMLLAYLVHAGLGVLPIPRKGQVFILIVLLFLYAAAAGFRAPAVRASLMASMLSFAYLVAREPDPISALAASSVGILLLAGTEHVLDLGFQISFIVVGSLVLAVHAWRDPPEAFLPMLWDRLKQGAMASVLAWLASIPIIAYHFGQISLIAVPSNLLVGFAIPFIIGFALSGWLVAKLNLAIGLGFLLPAQFLSGYLLAVVDVLGSFRYAAMVTPPFSGYWLPALYGVALILWRPLARAAP
ncbi:MAG: ComEC/Rec2 family competence protein [Fimbriimonadaceae bacterium]|nr:ComEC/Rec2 family competence protein [Fimbriimonadaceae bacterium]